MSKNFQLRTFCYLDQIQPKYASFLGTVIQGDLPVVGMASLFIEVAPGNEVFRLVDIAVKAAKVRPGAQVVEREFGLFELHSFSQNEVHSAGKAVLDNLGLKVADRVSPQIVSMQLITEVDKYQAQLLNRFRRGSTLIPRETMLVIECVPAAYSNFIMNEVEKTTKVEIINITGLGRFGRLWLSGTESEVRAAKVAAETAVEILQTG